MNILKYFIGWNEFFKNYLIIQWTCVEMAKVPWYEIIFWKNCKSTHHIVTPYIP
jgi:hypothetical protein